MNWHLYSLSTDKLQTMVTAQHGKIGDAIPPLDVFPSGIETAYTRYWESRLTSLHQVVVTRNRYVQLIEYVIKGHNEPFKIYSGIEATLSQRSKLLREIIDESAIVNVDDVLTTRVQRLTNCNRQAIQWPLFSVSLRYKILLVGSGTIMYLIAQSWDWQKNMNERCCWES